MCSVALSLPQTRDHITYRVSGKLMENTDIGITRESYREGYNLLGFDVDPMTSADFRYLGMLKNGHTK